MKTLLAAALLLALPGCAGQQLQPPPMPNISDVQALTAQTRTIDPTQVPEFYANGRTVAQLWCGGYFDQAVMASLQSAQTAGQAQILTGLLSGVMGLAGAGGPFTAGAGLGASAISGLLTNSQSNSLAGDHPAGLYTLTATAQQAIVAATPQPVTAADAWAALTNLYRQCRPAAIQALKEQAINAASSHLAVTGGAAVPAAPTGLAPALRGRAVPGVVYRSLPIVRVD